MEINRSSNPPEVIVYQYDDLRGIYDWKLMKKGIPSDPHYVI